MENDYPEEKWDLPNHQLIFMLNSSIQIYLKVQIAVDQEDK